MKPVSELRVLVVDDQKSMRALARLILSKIGIVVVEEAENANEAIGKLGTSNFDIAMLDWNMAGLSGLDLLKFMRKKIEWRHIVVVMATSESDSKKVQEALMAGANHYVIKPYQVEDLRRRLEQALRRPLSTAA